jgi:hypothetical protein
MVKRTHMVMLGMVGFSLLLSVALGEAQDARKVFQTC